MQELVLTGLHFLEYLMWDTKIYPKHIYTILQDIQNSKIDLYHPMESELL